MTVRWERASLIRQRTPSLLLGTRPVDPLSATACYTSPPGLQTAALPLTATTATVVITSKMPQLSHTPPTVWARPLKR